MSKPPGFFFTSILKAKINHILRTVPPKLTKKFASRFDALLEQTFLGILGVDSLTKEQWLQAALPTSSGGTGLVSHSNIVRYTAYLSSVASASSDISLCAKRLYIDATSGANNFSWSQDLSDVVVHFLNLSDPEKNLDLETVNLFVSDILNPDSSSNLSQHALSGKVQEANWEFYNNNVFSQLPKEDKVRIQSVAAQWLRAVPKEGQTKMTNEEFRASFFSLLGLEQPFIPPGLCCDCSRRTPVCGHGTHFNNCSSEQRTERHDNLRNLTIGLATLAGIKVIKEPLGTCPFQDKNFRPDIQLHNHGLPGYKDSSRPILLDIAVVHPTCPSYLDYSHSDNDSHAAETAYQRKISAFNRLQDEKSKASLDFIPIIFETFGNVHPKSAELFRALILKASLLKGVPYSIFLNYWSIRFSVLLQVGQSRMLLERSRRALKSSCPVNDVTAQDDWFPD